MKSLKGMGSDYIRFIGTVYDAATLRSLRFHSRSYVHGHRVGGTNPSLLEAMGCGNIVIAHDNELTGRSPVMPPCISDQPKMSRASCSRLKHCLSRKQQEMKTAAVARIRKFYDWEAITSRYEQLLREAIAKESP